MTMVWFLVWLFQGRPEFEFVGDSMWCMWLLFCIGFDLITTNKGL